MEVSEIVWWSLLSINFIITFVTRRANKRNEKLLKEANELEVKYLNRKFHLYRLVGIKTLHQIVHQVGQQAYECGLQEKTLEEAQSGVDSVLNTFNIKKESELDEDEQ